MPFRKYNVIVTDDKGEPLGEYNDLPHSVAVTIAKQESSEHNSRFVYVKHAEANLYLNRNGDCKLGVAW